MRTGRVAIVATRPVRSMAGLVFPATGKRYSCSASPLDSMTALYQS